jgi:hypothetical protein
LLTAVLGFSGGLSAAPLLNGDFASFDGWSADIAPSPSDPFQTVDPGADPRFTLQGGGFARLSDDDDYSDLVLYQEFDLSSAAAVLSFGYAWSLTAGDPGNPDFVQATLWLSDFSDFIDLFPDPPFTSSPSESGTATTDVSAFAGGVVLLEFFLQDGDGGRADWLEVGNITFAEAPLPSPAALMLLGLVPLVGRSLRGDATPRVLLRGQRSEPTGGLRRFERG